MEPQDTLTQIGAIAGIAAAVWLIVRDAVPLAVRSIRTTQEWAKRKWRCREEARAKREAVRQELVHEAEVDELLKEFQSAALRLRCILHSGDRYHPAELSRQQRSCKDLAIRYMAASGTRLSQRYLVKWCRLVRSETETLLISLHIKPPIDKALWVVVRWHPDPEFSGSEGDEAWRQLETVLARTVDDQELADVGWERPNTVMNFWAFDDAPFDARRFMPEPHKANFDRLSVLVNQAPE